MLKFIALLICMVSKKVEVLSWEYDFFTRHFKAESEDGCNFAQSIYDVIYAHEDFDMFFHFDRYYWDMADEVIVRMNSKSLKGASLIYYGANITRNDIFVRPLVRKVLHVIILKNMEDMVPFLNTAQNVNEHDEALFAVPDVQANMMFLTAGSQVKLFGKVLIIYFSGACSINVGTICYFCGKRRRKVVNISSNRAVLRTKLSFDKKEFKDFYGHVFKVGFAEYYPLITCEQESPSVINNVTVRYCLRAAGSEEKLIKVMSQKLNFDYQLIVYPSNRHILIDIEKRKLDFAIGGISVTSGRLNKSTFTKNYWFEGYYFFYLLSTHIKHELGRVLAPFDVHLWLLMVSSIFATALLLYALDRVETTKMERISCSDSLWTCLYMAIEQNANVKQVFKIRSGPALLLIAWILVCLNMSTAYKSKLFALVTNPPSNEPRNLQELVESDYKFVINEQYKEVFEELLLNTSDPVIQTALKSTTQKYDICEEFLYAVENRAAILDEYTALQYELRRSCKGEMHAKRGETETASGTLFRISKKSLRVVGQVWMLQKRVAYRSGFDQALSQIVEAGLVGMWINTQTKDMIKDSFPNSRSCNTVHHSPLSLRLLLSLFLLYAVGNLCALSVFIVESVCFKKYATAHCKNVIYKQVEQCQ